MSVYDIRSKDGRCAEQQERATRLSAAARKQLYQALDGELADADLAALVRSAAEPGLKQRIDAFRAARAKAQATKS